MAMTIFPVRINHEGTSKHYSAEFQQQEQYAKSWQSVLKRSYMHADVACTCYGKGSKRLAIRHYEAGHYGLARFPGSGSEHCPECRYYALDVDASGLVAYHPGVIEELASGMWRVRLSFDLNGESDTGMSKDDLIQIDDSSCRTAMSLKGLLHFLWSESRLNRWYPSMQGKRKLSLIHHLLRLTAKRILVDKRCLDDSMLVADISPGSPNARMNDATLQKALDAWNDLIVIAPLAKHSEERESGCGLIYIRGFAGIPRLAMPTPVWCKSLATFPKEIKAWRDGESTMAIMHCKWGSRLKKTPRLSVADIALMTVSKRWIPIGSEAERTLESFLHAQHRSFVKALEYDADSDEKFPSFWLLDTGRAEPYPVEAFDFRDDYTELKDRKARYNNMKYGVNGWCCWQTTKQLDSNVFPVLPERAR